MHEVILGQQVGAAALIVYIIQFLKYSPWASWYTAHSGTLNRWTSVVLAFVSSAGILWAMNGNVLEGGTLTITFPPLVQIINAVLHGFGQVAIQEGIYQATVKPTSMVQLGPNQSFKNQPEPKPPAAPTSPS
jgi:hypothetical protein